MAQKLMHLQYLRHLLTYTDSDLALVAVVVVVALDAYVHKFPEFMNCVLKGTEKPSHNGPVQGCPLSNFGLLFGPLSEFTSTLGKTANVNAFNAIVCDQCWQHCYTQCFSVAFHSSKIVCCKFLFRPWWLSLSRSRGHGSNLCSQWLDLKHVILLTLVTPDPTSIKHHCLIVFLVPVWRHLACFAWETSKSCESGLDPPVHFRCLRPRVPRVHELYPEGHSNAVTS